MLYQKMHQILTSLGSCIYHNTITLKFSIFPFFLAYVNIIRFHGFSTISAFKFFHTYLYIGQIDPLPGQSASIPENAIVDPFVLVVDPLILPFNPSISCSYPSIAIALLANFLLALPLVGDDSLHHFRCQSGN